MVAPAILALVLALPPVKPAPVSAAEKAEQGRFLAAVELAKAGKALEAAEAFEQLATQDSALADRALHQAGLLLEKAGELERSAELLARVSDRSYFFAEARLALARVQRAQGNLDEAMAAAEVVRGSQNRALRARAYAELSAIAEEAEDEAAAREARLQLALIQNPWLGGAPSLAVVTAAHDPLFRRNECQDARKAARRNKNQSACLAELLAAEAKACGGADVTEALRGLAQQCTQPEVQARIFMTQAVLDARADRLDDAAANFKAVAGATPVSALAAEALFAAFWVGWRAHPGTADGQALELLEELPVELGAQDRARARYWRSRLAFAQLDTRTGAKLLTEVAQLYPSTWYGHLARERLEALDPELADTVDPRALVSAPSNRAARAAAREELEAGIAAVKAGLEDGPAELMALARRRNDAASNSVAIEVLATNADPLLAHRFARSVVREQTSKTADGTVWKAAFPTNYAELFAANADGHATPSLLQGLTREESAFNPEATSHCGARGLMQLMPPTARAVAREQGKRLARLSELYQPERNISLGSQYLAQLLEKFDGNRAAAVAAYNGGPSRVARWLKNARPGQLEEWVEEIPLDETRNYVKAVLSSADVYAHAPGRAALATASRR